MRFWLGGKRKIGAHWQLLSVSIILWSLEMALPSMALAQVSDSLTSDNVRRLAVEHSPAVAAAKARVAQAERYVEVVSPVFPARPEIDVEYESGQPFQDADRVLRLGISQEFELRGQRGSRIAAATAALHQTQYSEKIAEREAVLKGLLAYNKVLAFSKIIEFTDSLLASATRIEDAASRRLTVGDISRLDYNSVLLENAAQRSARAEFRMQLENAFVELSQVLGYHVDANNPVASTALLAVRTDLDKMLTDTIGSRNPVLQQQYARVDELIAQRDLHTASISQNPQIGLAFTSNQFVIQQTDIHGSPATVGGITSIQKNEKSLGAKLTFGLPFSLGGLWPSSNQLYEAEAAGIAAAREDARRTENELRVKISSLQNSMRYLREALKSADQIDSLEQQNARLLEIGYLAGELSVTQYLTGRQQLNDVLRRQITLAQSLEADYLEFKSIVGE